MSIQTALKKEMGKTSSAKSKKTSKTPASSIEKPKKKRAKTTRIDIGPATLGETREIPVLVIKPGVKAVIDKSGKGTLNIGEILMSGGTLEYVKNSEPLRLRIINVRRAQQAEE